MFSGEQVTVPDVLGKDQQTAVELIKEAGLEVGTIDQSYNDDVDEGKVAEQTPNGNTKKTKGTKVNLVISKGPKPSEKVEVPQTCRPDQGPSRSRTGQRGPEGQRLRGGQRGRRGPGL